MSGPDLPEFERALQLSKGNLDSAELSESHGLLCGLLCRDASTTADAFMHHLNACQLVTDPGDALRSTLYEAFEVTSQQMDDEDMGFTLWLPNDDEPLEERTLSLAQWCSGFLVGLASVGSMETLSEEAQEAIEDLQQIARAELSGGGDADEEDENAFVEIVEYVRVVALMMREDLRGPGLQDAIH